MVDGQAFEGVDGAPLQPTTTPVQPQQGMGGFWFMLLILALFMFVLIIPQRREKKRRNAMLDALKKGDRVQTVGGIIGTIVEIRPTELVVKVDENTNTRMRFGRNAIQAVLGGEEA
jgi:preprotein translocase subunit YajC